MNNKPELSIIIVNYNSGKYLYNTIRSVYNSAPDSGFEIIIVDNNSSDSSLTKVIEDFPEIRLIELEINAGFGKANNIGAESAGGKYLLFLNNDTEVLKDSIDTLVSEIKDNPDYGIVSPLLFYEDGSCQLNYGNDPGIISEFLTKYFSKFIFRFNTKFKGENFEKNADWISGACFIISSKLYKELEGFDEYFFLYYEDADLGKRVRSMGLKNHLTSKSRIVHFLGKSTSPVFNELLPLIKEGHLYYYRKHNSVFSFNVLRAYLLFRFNLKRIFAVFTGNPDRSKIFEKTITAIKNFK
ncbi:MAG: glycosyltransferase family 2 protein [Acidobacteriota bacterium]